MSAGSSFARSRSTWLAYLLLVYYSYLQSSFGPVVPHLRRELGLDYTTASLHLSLFSLGSMVAGLSGGTAERALGRWAMLWAGTAGMAAGALILAAGGSAPVTLSGAFLMGAIGTWVLVVVHATLADEHGGRRGIALTEANAGASLGALAVPLVVASAQAGPLGWRAALGLPALAAAALALRFGRVRPVTATSGGEAPIPPGSLPLPFRLLLVVLYCLVAVEWSLAFWGATFLADEIGLPAVQAVPAMSGFFGAMLAGRLLGSVIARRLRPAVVLQGALGLTVLGFPLLWTARSAGAGVAGLVVLGLAIGNLWPMTMAVGLEIASAGHRALGSGRLVLVASLSVLTVPLALGRVADAAGLRVAFAAIPLLLGVAALALRAALRPTPGGGGDPAGSGHDDAHCRQER